MIEISNLRKYFTGGGDKVRLEADINFTDMDSPYSQKSLWFEIDKEHGDMLADDTYDAFVLVPLFVAMYHKQDLHICGNISKKLYQNIKWYIPKILCDFSPALSPVNFTVDGFNPPKPKGTLIGASISCGVDCLSTIYDHFVNETDPDYRINSLFLFNYGSCGDFGDPLTNKTFKNRLRRNSFAAKDIGLPLYYLDTNLHAITHARNMGGQKLGYFALYSCIFSLQNSICRYYTSNGSTYEEKKIFRIFNYDHDMAGFGDSYIVPLIQADNVELIIDGCQYRRVDKVKRIADWDIVKKYLNVCVHRTSDASNCGHCHKCLRTLLPLEILGKLDDYSKLFNMEQYRKVVTKYKIQCLQDYGKEPFETENVDFARENNFPMPTLPKPVVKKSAVKKSVVPVAKNTAASLDKK